jgi:hypothetical protein
MITSDIKSVTFENGRRVEVVENTYSPSDDMMKLGQLQNMLGQMMARKEQLLAIKAEAEANPEAANVDYKSELTRIDGEMDTYTALISKQQEYVSGYGKE